MHSAGDPAEILIAQLVIVGVIGFILWRLIVWVRNAPVKPNPWDAQVPEAQLEEAQEACPHCSTPQPPTAWFCEHCGKAVGPYNNMMPFLQIFSEGEVLRNATSGYCKKRPLILAGYILIGLALIPFFLAPIYWLSLLLNFRKPRSRQETEPHQNVQ